jgi:hypothetical protein
MKLLRSFAAFWYDFIIGDDWRIALGVVIGLTVSWVTAHSLHLAAWWILPVVVVITLAVSLRVAIRKDGVR